MGVFNYNVYAAKIRLYFKKTTGKQKNLFFLFPCWKSRKKLYICRAFSPVTTGKSAGEGGVSLPFIFPFSLKFYRDSAVYRFRPRSFLSGFARSGFTNSFPAYGFYFFSFTFCHIWLFKDVFLIGERGARQPIYSSLLRASTSSDILFTASTPLDRVPCLFTKSTSDKSFDCWLFFRTSLKTCNKASAFLYPSPFASV